MARTTIRTEDIADSEITTAKILDGTIATGDMAVDPTDADNLSSGSVPAARLGNVDLASVESEAADNRDNIGSMACRIATVGGLDKFDIANGMADGFANNNGVDSGASTNVYIDPAKFCRGGVAVSAGEQEFKITGGVKSFDWTAPGGLSTLSDVLVVAGGGGGGASGGGGGAGGLVYKQSHTVSGGTTYTIVIGDGGTGASGQPTNTKGTNGENSTAFGMTAVGGGGGGATSRGGDAGGSGGGAGGANNLPAGTGNQTDSGGGTGFGNPGGATSGNPKQATAGGGGAGGSGNGPNSSHTWQNRATTGGNGGAGKDYSSVFGTGYGHDGWFAGGGGGAGGGVYGGLWGWGNGGSSGKGGGSHGGSPGGGTDQGQAIDATDDTGGGGGGGAPWNWYGPAGDGGSGVVMIKWAAFESYDDLTLTSVGTASDASSSVPTEVDIVLSYSNGYGTSTVGTDLKAYVSRDDGTTWTLVTLVTKTPATGQIIVAARGVDISGQPSGRNMRYKITTHNQSAAKSTFIHGASLAWR